MSIWYELYFLLFLKASDHMSIWYKLFFLLCFDRCLLAYSYNHAVMLALNHGISRLLAYILLTFIGISRFCNESAKSMESSSPESQINTRLLRPGFQHFCSKQRHGNASGSTSCFSNSVFLTLPAVVPIPSSPGGFRHYRPLHCNLLLLIFSACVFQGSHWHIPQTFFQVSVLIRILFFLDFPQKCSIVFVRSRKF